MHEKKISGEQVTREQILSAVEAADNRDMWEIINAVIRRYGRVFPDEAVIFLSLPLEPAKRRAELEAFLVKLRDNTLE